MARSTLLIAAALLTGCQSAASKAEAKYEFLKQQHADEAEVCAAGRAWVRALADAQDSLYAEESVIVDVGCQSGEMRGSYQRYGEPDMEADNMDALPDNVQDAPNDNSSAPELDV